MPPDAKPEPEALDDRRNRNSTEQESAPRRQSLIDELEASISQKNIGSRAEILRQITDLFVAGSGYFDGEQMALFDDVMDRLVNEIDHSARWRNSGYAGICTARWPAVVPAILPNTEPAMRPVPPG